MKCKNCGKELDPNKDFCFFCGASYKNKELDHHLKVALRELAIEEVRKEKYPEFPSRLY